MRVIRTPAGDLGLLQHDLEYLINKHDLYMVDLGLGLHWTQKDVGDSTHVAATAFDTSFSRPNIVTTEEVLTEFLTYFAGRGPMLRKKAAAITTAILTDPSIWVLPQTHESFLAGLALYAARLDKAYSLADCISMQSMRRESLYAVLTNDHHFEQEGFRTMFRLSE